MRSRGFTGVALSVRAEEGATARSGVADDRREDAGARGGTADDERGSEDLRGVRVRAALGFCVPLCCAVAMDCVKNLVRSLGRPRWFY